MKHKPLIERYTTVTGKELAKPGNFIVRLGTPACLLIDACGGLPVSENKVLSGGPMMGKALISLDTPIVKGSNSITILSGREARRHKPGPCLRCAKCVDVCPMGLEPYLLATASRLSSVARQHTHRQTDGYGNYKGQNKKVRVRNHKPKTHS